MTPPIDTPGWHARFLQQAGWTQQLREFGFRKAGLQSARRFLEVGCGTGVITREAHRKTSARVFGLDINPHHLEFARKYDPGALFIRGDGLALPFADGSFDLAGCHFLLLWVSDPLQVVREMRRVVQEGGWVLALAEPDYGGRVDYPAELAELGRLQGEALRQQGADPNTGRRLAAIFHAAGLREVETGVLGGRWSGPVSDDAWEMEWQVLEADLAGRVPATRLQELRRIDAAAWQHGERVLFVPTFYAWGKSLALIFLAFLRVLRG